MRAQSHRERQHARAQQRRGRDDADFEWTEPELEQVQRQQHADEAVAERTHAFGNEDPADLRRARHDRSRLRRHRAVSMPYAKSPTPDCRSTFGALGAPESASTAQRCVPFPVTPAVQPAGNAPGGSLSNPTISPCALAASAAIATPISALSMISLLFAFLGMSGFAALAHAHDTGRARAIASKAQAAFQGMEE